MGNELRRREMVAASDEPDKPYPYSISDWEAGDARIKATLSNWNNMSVDILSTYTSAGCLFNFFDGKYVGGSGPGTSPTYLTIPSGSSVNVKITNISNPNSMPIEVFASVGGSNTQISSLKIARFTNSSDKSVTASFSSDTTLGGIWLYVVRTGRYVGYKFSCDLEVYVDGVRMV